MYQKESKDDYNEDLLFYERNNVKFRISSVHFGAGLWKYLPRSRGREEKEARENET